MIGRAHAALRLALIASAVFALSLPAHAGPPKPGEPKKCSVSVVGDVAAGGAMNALLVVAGLGVIAARRRGRR